jgi:DNA (cytosine-5)-methyltransferase 1
MELTFIEMFSGIGGFRLGLERAGWRCVWANDIDKYASAVYRRHFGEKELIEGDIRTIDADSIPEHTLLTAGFPCQSFSVAGRRKGFEDARGTLFYDVTRIASAKRPPLLLLENVKGILSIQRGYCFTKILQTLDELGYDVEWQVLNSKYFGVPQNRERVFIIGHLREACTKPIFPIATSFKNTVETSEEGLIVYDGHHKKFTKELGTLTGRENRRGGSWIIMLSHTKANIKQRLQKRFETWTLDGTSTKMAVVDSLKIRRLTPVECERLQGFPDGWTEFGITKDGKTIKISDTQRYRLLGNAVTVNVVEFLGLKLYECLRGFKPC